MTNNLHRRDLQLRNLDEVIREVENLRLHGYEKAGNWDLAQTCGHLANWLSYPIDGFPRAGCMIGTMLWLIRNTVGKGLKKKILATGGFKERRPTIPESVPAVGGDEIAAVERLKSAIERFKNFNGPIRPSPIFGPMDKEEAGRLQTIHCAHHLSFLIPKAN